jgi:hypothetical protein
MPVETGMNSMLPAGAHPPVGIPSGGCTPGYVRPSLRDGMWFHGIASIRRHGVPEGLQAVAVVKPEGRSPRIPRQHNVRVPEGCDEPPAWSPELNRNKDLFRPPTQTGCMTKIVRAQVFGYEHTVSVLQGVCGRRRLRHGKAYVGGKGLYRAVNGSGHSLQPTLHVRTILVMHLPRPHGRMQCGQTGPPVIEFGYGI